MVPFPGGRPLTVLRRDGGGGGVKETLAERDCRVRAELLVEGNKEHKVSPDFVHRSVFVGVEGRGGVRAL